MKTNKTLKIGDVVEMEIPGISNHIVIALGPSEDRVDVYPENEPNPGNKRRIGVPIHWIKRKVT